jgi:purine-binding chemotaxis protein CheW
MASGDSKYLIFSLQGSLYTLNLTQVAEVGDLPKLWPIPLAPDCYSGAMNFHGDIVAVLDLAAFLGLGDSIKPGKVIVLQRDVTSLAFLVDAIVRIATGDEVSIDPAPDADYVAAMVTFSDCKALQLDLDEIVRGAELLMQQKFLQ